MASLPPDRAHISTEQRHVEVVRDGLDTRPTHAVVRLVAETQARAAQLVADCAGSIEAFVDDAVAGMDRGGRLLLLGAGTSGRLGVLDASECPPTFGCSVDDVIGLIAGGDTALRRSAEGMEDNAAGALPELERLNVAANDAVLGITAGGTTPWVLGALDAASQRGATTALLTCARRDRPSGCTHLLLLDTGAELLAGSTRLAAGSATKTALNAITTAIFVRRGAVYGDLMVDLKATNDKLLDRAIRILRLFRPTLDRSAAAAAMQQADGGLKVAIVCVCCDVDASEAQARLAKAHGQLRSVLDSVS